MAEADWTYLNDGLDIATVDRGVTAGIARPPGGGSFLYAFNSLAAVNGAVALFANLASFAPMAKGGSIRGVLQRGPGGRVDQVRPIPQVRDAPIARHFDSDVPDDACSK